MCRLKGVVCCSSRWGLGRTRRLARGAAWQPLCRQPCRCRLLRPWAANLAPWLSTRSVQIRLKAQALVGFVGQQHGFQHTYALLTLANKLVSQCEVQVRRGGAAPCNACAARRCGYFQQRPAHRLSTPCFSGLHTPLHVPAGTYNIHCMFISTPVPLQVTRLHSFAFPLAEVAVAVMAAHPDFVPLLAARLHQVGVGGRVGGTGPCTDRSAACSASWLALAAERSCAHPLHSHSRLSPPTRPPTAGLPPQRPEVLRVQVGPGAGC